MAIKKISELPIASAGDAVDGYVPVVIADDTKRVRVGDIGGTTSWDEVAGKPSTFPPSSHTHTKSQITDLQAVESTTITTLVTSTEEPAEGTPSTTITFVYEEETEA